MLSLCEALIRDVYDQFGPKLLVLIIMVLVTGLLDGLGMTLLLPFLDLVGIGGGGSQVISNFLAKSLGSSATTPMAVMGMIVTVFLLQAVLIVFHGWMLAKTEADYVTYWRKQLLRAFFDTSWTFVANHKVGNLVYMVTAESERIGRAFFLMLQLFSTAVIAFIYCSVALYISWQFSVFLLVILFIMAAIIARAAYMRSYSSGKNYNDSLSDTQFLMTDFLGGIKLVKATATESKVYGKISPILEKAEKSYVSMVFIPATIRAIVELVAIILFCLLLIMGASTFSVGAGISLVLIAIFFRLMPKIYHAQFYFQLLATYLPSVKNIRQILQGSEKYPDRTGVSEVWERPDSTCVEIRKLSLAYGDVWALNNVSFSIPANSVIGIVGSSGSGKSSLANCLLGLVSFNRGDILVNGVSLEKISIKDWRRSVGYVTQEAALFNDTIRENLLWATEEVGEEEMIKAAKKAHIHEFIMGLPERYDTVVGDRGVRLSGGERQRLALARALIGNPLLLILDEATSALDSKSEREVLRAIKALRGQMTIVMIAHRLSTVRWVDNIIVLEAGRVVEQGCWDALIANDSHFSGFWKLQQ